MTLAGPDQEKQTRIHITSTETRFTNPISELVADPSREDDDTVYLYLQKQGHTKSSNVAPMDGGTGLPALLQSDEIQVRPDEAGDGLHDLPYEDVEAVGATGAPSLPAADRDLRDRLPA